MDDKRPILDLDHLAAMTSGDPALAAEIIEIFRGQVDTWGRLLDPSSDQVQWADAAHTIKGAALGIGAMELSDVCAAAERTGRDRPVSQAEAALILNDVRAAILEALEAASREAHRLDLAAPFRAA